MEKRYSKLRGRIVEKYRNLSNFADAVGVKKPVISNKLNGKVPITSKDIEKWIQPLDIPLEEIGVYFFYFES